MQASEKVTIISATYNSENHIRSFVESVQRQDYRNYELLIIENASKDATRTILESEFPWVTVVPLIENIGYRRANSLAFKLCETPLILVCNDDVVLQSDCLSELVRAMKDSPAAAMICPLITLFDNPGVVNTAGNTLSLTGFYSARGKNRKTELYAQPSELASVSGCCFLYRHDCYLKLGGFSDDFDSFPPAWHASYEDVDLSFRVRAAGYKILFQPSAVLQHRYVQKPMSQGRFSSMLFGRLLLILRNFEALTIAKLSVLYLFCEIGVAFYALLRGPSYLREVVRVWGWIVTHSFAILTMRKNTQSTRTVRDQQLLGLFDTMFEVSPVSDRNPFVARGAKFVGWFSHVYRKLVLSDLAGVVSTSE